ncbi:MAG: glycosyltransferase [Cellulomonadaceae bacterium]
MSAPVVDVVIAVHTTARPAARAAASVLAGAGDLARVTVVCHGVGIRSIEETFEDFSRTPGSGAYTYAPDDPRLRFLSLNDAVPSPSGPFNWGLDNAHAPYVALLGSDDVLAPHAIRRWVRAAQERGSDALLAPLEHADGTRLHNPLVRPGTGRLGPFLKRPLDPVLDRVAYRSAPLGLLRRETVDRLGLRLTPGLRSGGDLELSTRLWFSGARLDFVPSLPAYVIGADASDRVTFADRPLAVELEAIGRLRAQPWLAELGPAQRRAVAIKVLRIHVLGATARRAEQEWGPEDLAALQGAARDWALLADGVLDPFARADRAVLDAAVIGDRDSLLAAVRARPAAGRIATILPPDLTHAWDREGTLRRYLRYRLPW